MHRADQLVVLAAEVAQPGAHGHELLLAPPARLLDRGALVGGEHHRALELVQHDAYGDGDGLRGATLADQPLAALGGAGARLALGLRGAQQRVGATVERAGALLGGAQRRAGRPSRPAGPRGPPRRDARARRCRAPPR